MVRPLPMPSMVFARYPQTQMPTLALRFIPTIAKVTSKPKFSAGVSKRFINCAPMLPCGSVPVWNFHPTTLENRRHQVLRPTYQADLDWIAIAPDGTFAAFCDAHIFHERNTRTGRKEGWITGLGTRRGFRRQGLGRAMLLLGLQQLQQAGMETALLGVDAENSNQAQTLYKSVGFAQTLYKSVGFETVETSVSYTKRVST